MRFIGQLRICGLDFHEGRKDSLRIINIGPPSADEKKIIKIKIIGSNWFELVPHDLAGADLLDTRADLRQPVTGPARLSRRDVRVACTQV